MRIIKQRVTRGEKLLIEQKGLDLSIAKLKSDKEVLDREISEKTAWLGAKEKTAKDNLDFCFAERKKAEEDCAQLKRVSSGLEEQIKERADVLSGLESKRKNLSEELAKLDFDFVSRKEDIKKNLEEMTAHLTSEEGKLVESIKVLEQKKDKFDMDWDKLRERETAVSSREEDLKTRDKLITLRERALEKYARRIVGEFEKQYPNEKIKFV